MTDSVLIGIVVMACVTYAIRMTPLVLLRKEIKNRFFRSFLHYVPYAALSVMLFPSILFSTGNFIASLFGFLTALLLAWCRRSLITVALVSCAVAYVTQKFLV